jgi:methionine synthase I (cobalamin-dependent)
MADLATLMAEKDVLLADGATGTNLFDMGLTSGDAPEMWLELHPDRIKALHKSFVDAGSDIILTNTFGCNARRLMLHDMQDQVFKLNKLAAELCREEAEKANRPIVVAGSIGPTGDLLAPLGPLTEAEAKDVFIDQMEGLKAGGVDVAWIETMSAGDEMRAAAEAAAAVGMPYVVTASFDTAGRTMMGLTPEAFVELLASFDPKPLAVGANCGVGASDLVASVLGMTAAEHDLPFGIVAKANCGIPVIQGENVVYTGTPELMADYTHLAVNSGAKIVGGCCGTSPVHLKAMRDALDAHKAGKRPSVDEVIEAIGALISPPAGAAAEESRADRKARRRRG